jgi:hypothetical protein
MLLLRSRLLSGYVQLALPSRCLYRPSSPFIHRLPHNDDTLFQIRLKSRKAKSWVPKQPQPEPISPHKLQSSNTRSFPKDPSSTTCPIKPPPIKPPPANYPPSSGPRKSDVEPKIYATFTPMGEVINDIVEWQHSRLFLAILANTAAFIVYCFWVREAHRSAKAKEEFIEGQENEEKGKYVTGTIQDTRFITPGQEWLLDNFTLTPINVREGRYWTLITSLFSHQLPTHAAGNMVISHLLLTALCPIFGTIPVGLAFVIGGTLGNVMSVAWMAKRGKSVYQEKYPGQFFGGLGMSGANYAVLGFGATAYPNWYINVFRVWPVRMSYVVIFAWLFEAFQYWRHTGWEKIQSAVLLNINAFC